MNFHSVHRNLSDMLFLLGDEKRKLPFILATFLVVSLLDLIGVGLVGSYITLFTQPRGSELAFLKPILSQLEFFEDDQGKSMLALGCVLVFVFVRQTHCFFSQTTHPFAYQSVSFCEMVIGASTNPRESWSSRISQTRRRPTTLYSSALALFGRAPRGTTCRGLGERRA